MEFPNLGTYCFEKTCSRLDYLPMKCDACLNVFCKDHISYSLHNCQNAQRKNAQVPVCPLCNTPVPSKRGEQPDIAVGEHIDRDCQADPAVSQRKIYTNRCNVKGCKQKELVRITCDSCCKTFCVKHRHPTDHQCQEQNSPTPAQRAAAAAAARAHNSKRSMIPNWFNRQSTSGGVSVDHKNSQHSLPVVSVTSVQGRLTEDEALARALHESLNVHKPKNIQEEEDRLMALALANCDQNRIGNRRSSVERNCSVS